MNKSQIIIVVLGILLVVAMFSLPKIVVDNDIAEEKSFIDESNSGGIVDHSSIIPEDVLPRVKFWKKQLIIGDAFQKNLQALDSLMYVFIQINKYDSAAFYAEKYAQSFSTVSHWQKAGDAYFEAFTFALDRAKVNMLGQKARSAYELVLEQQPNNFDVKHNVAMILVSSSNPMQGIMMLREIIQSDPSNEKVLVSMGRMSINTGQFENAVMRFETLISYYPEHMEGNFFLGVCYYETGQSVKAKAQFEKVKTLGASEQILTAVNEYLEKIS